MKKIALTVALIMVAGAATAGNVLPVAMDAPMMVESHAPGSGALVWIIPLIAIAAIALAADN